MKKKIQKKRNIFSLLFGFFGVAFFIVYFFLLWHNMIVVVNGEIVVGSVTIWGDWAMHFSQASAMAYRSLILTEHPLLYGQPFSYPFFVNFISAVLFRIGIPLIYSFVFISYMSCLLTVLFLFFLFVRFLKKIPVATVALFLFFFNGGLGFVFFLSDFFQKMFRGVSTVLLPESYTRIGLHGIEWMNLIPSMFVPQRAFTFGFPLALLLLFCAWIFWFSWKKSGKKQYVFVMLLGLSTGFLSLVHTHSFIAVVFIQCFWMLSVGVQTIADRNTKHFLQFLLLSVIWGVSLILAAVPIFSTLYSSAVTSTTHGSFIRWYPGWFVNPEADHHRMSWIIFWIINWGPVLPLAIYGFLTVKEKERYTLLPFFLLFVFGNLFLFQPYIWDNTKIFAWASVGISLAAAYGIVRLFSKKGLVMKLLALVLFFISIFSGYLDATQGIDKTKHHWTMYSADDIRTADFVIMNTDPNDRFLTSDRHNHPIPNLTGRKILMGYRGWLWTYGFDYKQIENDMLVMFQGGDQAQKLFKQYGISYVVFDGTVRKEYQGNESYFAKQYSLIYRSEEYAIYKVQE